LLYKIEKNFKPQNTNNIIECRVYKFGNIYIAHKELEFGYNNSSGTEAVLFLCCEKYDKETDKVLEELGSTCIVNINDEKE
jgi:hypothetical protein